MTLCIKKMAVKVGVLYKGARTEWVNGNSNHLLISYLSQMFKKSTLNSES